MAPLCAKEKKKSTSAPQEVNNQYSGPKEWGTDRGEAGSVRSEAFHDL